MSARSIDNSNCTFSRRRTIPEVVIGHHLQHIAGCRKILHYCFRTWKSRWTTPEECQPTTHSLQKSRRWSKLEAYIHTYIHRCTVSAAISDCRSLLESPRYTSCEFVMVECRSFAAGI